MYKSLLETYNEKQMEILRSKMWWVADQHKPYLLKFAIESDFLLLQITDLRSLWAVRLHNDTLLKDKNTFIKPLQLKDKKDLLTLFESLLSTSDTQALYQFKEQGSEIHFSFKKLIKIFDFNWTFKLQKANCNPVQLICRQIITPFAAVLEAQSKRIEVLKKKFEQIEKDYIRKMTEMQKNLYKSPLIEEKEDWLQHLSKAQGGMLNFMKIDKDCQFLFSNCVLKQKKRVQNEVLLAYSQRRPKPGVKLERDNRFEMAQSLLVQELQQQKVKLRKERKIDFI